MKKEVDSRRVICSPDLRNDEMALHAWLVISLPIVRRQTVTSSTIIIIIIIIDAPIFFSRSTIRGASLRCMHVSCSRYTEFVHPFFLRACIIHVLVM